MSKELKITRRFLDALFEGQPDKEKVVRALSKRLGVSDILERLAKKPGEPLSLEQLLKPGVIESLSAGDFGDDARSGFRDLLREADIRIAIEGESNRGLKGRGRQIHPRPRLDELDERGPGRGKGWVESSRGTLIMDRWR